MFNLPNGYQWKSPDNTDAQAIADMVNRSSEMFSGGVRFTEAEIVAEIEEVDASWGICQDNGDLVAYELLWVNQDRAIFEIDGVVHPDYLGQSLGSTLVQIAEHNIRSRWAEMRQGDKSPKMQVQFNGRDENAVQLFTEQDFCRLKQDLVLEIQLNEMSPPPIWKSGFAVRDFMIGQDDRAVFDVVDASFQSVAGYSERSIGFAEWRDFSIERAGFDPSLWFLAIQDEKVVGVCLCPHDKEVGWVRNLGIHPDYRGNGLGVALMQHAFRIWYERGYPTIQLAVQGDNIPAIRLYEKVGMSTIGVYETFAKSIE